MSRYMPLSFLFPVAIVAAVTGATACSSTAGSGGAAAALPCAPKPAGSLCIRIFSSGATLDDAIGYLSASGSPLQGVTWRLVLSTYSCDPGEGRVSRCPASGTFPGPARTGPPPMATSCREGNGSLTSAPPGCHDTVAQEMATHADWTGFYGGSGPRPVFRSETWICVSEEVLSAGTWEAPPAVRMPSPRRACASLKPG